MSTSSKPTCFRLWPHALTGRLQWQCGEESGAVDADAGAALRACDSAGDHQQFAGAAWCSVTKEAARERVKAIASVKKPKE